MRITLLIFATIIFSGCATSLHVARPEKAIAHAQRLRVYVTNPNQSREYKILEYSDLYQISPEDDGCPRLTLCPLRQYSGCANPLIGSALTLGILPGYLSTPILFRYNIKDGTRETSYLHHIQAYQRYSIWEHFMSQDELRIIGEGLRYSERQEEPNKAPARGSAHL
jgi:hypothetical protein